MTREKLGEFFLGPEEKVLQPQDILLGIHLGVPDSRSSGAYLKFSRRGGMEIALLGIGVQIRLDKSFSICEDVAIALGVSAPTPIRMRKAEGVLKGEKISDNLLFYAAELASQDASPRDS